MTISQDSESAHKLASILYAYTQAYLNLLPFFMFNRGVTESRNRLLVAVMHWKFWSLLEV